MKKAWLIAFSCVLASIPGFSQPQSAVSFDLAAILSPPAVTGSCALRPSAEPLTPLAPVRTTGLESACTATASCGSYGTVSCEGASTCSATDRNCPNRGYVICDGVYTYCPICTIEDFCQKCAETNDCRACCRCQGYSPFVCRDECGGGD